MDSVVLRANNIHKSVKNDLGAALTYMGRLRGKERRPPKASRALGSCWRTSNPQHTLRQTKTGDVLV